MNNEESLAIILLAVMEMNGGKLIVSADLLEKCQHQYASLDCVGFSGTRDGDNWVFEVIDGGNSQEAFERRMRSALQHMFGVLQQVRDSEEESKPSEDASILARLGIKP